MKLHARSSWFVVRLLFWHDFGFAWDTAWLMARRKKS